MRQIEDILAAIYRHTPKWFSILVSVFLLIGSGLYLKIADYGINNVKNSHLINSYDFKDSHTTSNFELQDIADIFMKPSTHSTESHRYVTLAIQARQQPHASPMMTEAAPDHLSGLRLEMVSWILGNNCFYLGIFDCAVANWQRTKFMDETLFRQARDLEAANDLARSEFLRRAVIEISPEKWWFHQELGDHYWRLGDRQKASDVFELGSTLATPPESYYLLGRSLGLRGDRQSEGEMYLKAYESGFETAKVLFGLGDWSLANNREEQAVVYYTRCLDLEPTDLGCYLRLGAIAEERDEMSIAESWYKQAIANVEPKHKPRVLYLLGNLYLNETRYLDAQSIYSQLIAQDAAYTLESHAGIIVALILSHDYEKLVQHIQQMPPTVIDAFLAGEVNWPEIRPLVIKTEELSPQIEQVVRCIVQVGTCEDQLEGLSLKLSPN